MLGLVALCGEALASTLHVSPESASPSPPYATWETAARSIQDAVDAAEAGDLVLITNGVYATGGRALKGGLTNRVAILTEVTLRSVNGPAVTIVQGAAAHEGGLGPGAVRCVYLGAGAVLDGLTLTGGHTLSEPGSPETSGGGGVFGLSTNSSLVTHCVLRGNSADQGGGAYGAVLVGCRLVENQAGSGGGAADCRLENCWIVGNAASDGGGGVVGGIQFIGSERRDGSVVRNCLLAGNRAGKVGGGAAGGTAAFNCTFTGNSAGLRGGGIDETVAAFNSIVFYNEAPQYPEYALSGNGSLTYCSSRPLPAGTGNTDGEPQLVSSSHLSTTSPCLGAGSSAYAAGRDIDGEPWALPPSIGADQGTPGPATGYLRVSMTADVPQVVVGQPLRLRGTIEGWTSANRWDFGDGTVVTNVLFAPFVRHRWSVPGRYEVTLTAFNQDFPAGVSSTGLVEVVAGRYFVDAASPAPAVPYATWTTAARTIDEAIQVALPGAVVLVTNGVYAQGGRAIRGEMTRTLLDRPVRVESIGGPTVTIIRGESGVRCAVVGTGAVLSGFTLTQGDASSGGGAYVEGSGVVSNCIIIDNRARTGAGVYGHFGARIANCRIERNTATRSSIATGGGEGGGVYGAGVVNSVLNDNTAEVSGGGARGCDLRNCTVVGNRAGERGGGLASGSMVNCLVLFNTAPNEPNFSDLEEVRFSCTQPLPPGPGNLDADPRLASASHLSTDSPCVGAGSAADASGVDIDGELWESPPCIGADQVVPGQVTGPLSCGIGVEHDRVADGFAAPFSARIGGRVTRHLWDFGDGSWVTNAPFVKHAWMTPGRYEVRLKVFNETEPNGVAASATVEVLSVPVFHVRPDATGSRFPYETWETAATTIQEAIEASVPGRQVLVANGVYETGTHLVGNLPNRVVVDRAVSLRSVDGPAATVIRGGVGIRGVRMASGAVLSGFTITGASLSGYVDNGAGVWGETNAVVTNCWVVGNTNDAQGGGVFGGVIQRSRLANNWASAGGGAHSAVLQDCVISGNGAGTGGGASKATLVRCLVEGNWASALRGSYGGGAESSRLDTCVLRGNRADFGGGAFGSELVRCTVVENAADMLWWVHDEGGGTSGCTVQDSIIFHNECPANPATANYWATTFSHSCTSPLPDLGEGNLATEPGFVDRAAGDLRLRPDSPCLDRAGSVMSPGTRDRDGVPRPLDGDGDGWAVGDFGAFEFLRPSSDSNADGIPDGWTWGYGLDPTDREVAAGDPDHDGVRTGDEWLADTDPTAAVSRLHIKSLSPGPPLTIVLNTSKDRVYTLERRGDWEGDGWIPVVGQSQVPGIGGPMTLLDTQVQAAGYYRVKAGLP